MLVASKALVCSFLDTRAFWSWGGWQTWHLAPRNFYESRLSAPKNKVGVLSYPPFMAVFRKHETARFISKLPGFEQRLLLNPRSILSSDPYFYPPASYRYSRGGSYYETNQYGAKMLQQAVNYGYEEGFRAGQADLQDRWRSTYHDSYAYQDANYSYSGYYVDRDDYNCYFREGFRRSYEEGDSRRYQYGRYSNGKSAILGNILSGILNLESLR